ncbi:decapping and exoribonuclease protein [Ambystoma mexicanum]|uniref:decapping and exoribonuclease protein n=1 Tax=Ambystoma mexicanum TaxID=8296 RepID=UPI0037E7547F
MEEQVSLQPAYLKRKGVELKSYPSKHLQAVPGSVPGPEDSSSLPVLRVRQDLYDANFPFYQQPVEIGGFSLDADRQFFNDARRLRFYCPPPDEKNPGFDLRDGYQNRYVKRDESIKEKLDHLLRWITLNRRLLSGKDSKGMPLSCLNREFATWRGHLTKLLTTPYENQEGWLLAVTLFQGTYYISEVETEQAKRQRDERTADHEEMMYMGYKFEQYLCADEPGGAPDPAGVVNTNEAFCSVVQTKLHGHSLLFSGEVDCKDPAYPNQEAPGCYVELKTSKEIRSPNQQRSFNRYKLIKWWAQSFLPGVPRIIAGFRDEEGRVVSMQTFETMKISHLIRGEWNSWKPAVCMNFCNAFLTFVKKVVTLDDPQVVYLFSWEPRHDVSYTVHKNSDLSFLPPWYVSAMTTQEK